MYYSVFKVKVQSFLCLEKQTLNSYYLKELLKPAFYSYLYINLLYEKKCLNVCMLGLKRECQRQRKKQDSKTQQSNRFIGENLGRQPTDTQPEARSCGSHVSQLHKCPFMWSGSEGFDQAGWVRWHGERHDLQGF